MTKNKGRRKLKTNDFHNSNRIATVVVLLLFISVITKTLPATAQVKQHDYLTLEILQKKVNNFTQVNGRDSIDLSNFIIDLSKTDSDFNQQFYQEINNILGRSSKAIDLIFDRSIFQGDFQLERLGISGRAGKAGLPSLFTALEREQIDYYYPLDSSVVKDLPPINIFRGKLKFDDAVFTGEVTASRCLFLQPLIATAAKFQDVVNFYQPIFGREVDFNSAIFNQNIVVNRGHFWEKTNFKQVDFQGITDFSNSKFEAVTEFNGASFQQLVDFTRTVFVGVGNFSQTRYRDRALFAKSKFLDTLIFIDSSFEKTATFRDIYLSSLVNLRGLHLLDRLDFSNAFFSSQAQINTSGLAFDSAEAKIIGKSGIGKYIRVDRLEANETVLQNLIRNFRSLEQIADANYLEYQREQLRAKQLSRNLTNITWQQLFSWSWLSLIPQWLSLNLLLLLGNYGTNLHLLFAIGIIVISFFSYLFWLVDRYRPKISQPIIPTRQETILMSGSYLTLTVFSLINIFLTSDRPYLTLFCIAIIILPVPILITSLIYLRGRYHKLLDISYFVEDGSLREFRLLIGRLPIMPRFPFFRDRYQPIVWSKRWSWLNYYDLSLNNIFKLGFNDIRLRDLYLPGYISTLVWYQWCVGVLYIILLLWTLSRTIPGLNLLLYF